MANGHTQAGGIHQVVLQGILPQSWTIAIAPAAIGQDQHGGHAGIVQVAIRLPPPLNGVHRKFSGVSGGSDIHEPGIPLRIIQPIRDGDALRQRTKIIDIDPMWISAPNRPGILEQADQLAFLGVHIDDGPPALDKGLFLSLQILELLIPMWAGQGQGFAIDLARIIQRFEQPPHRGGTRRMSRTQGRTQAAQTLVFPFERTARIARRVLG